MAKKISEDNMFFGFKTLKLNRSEKKKIKIKKAE